MERLEIKRKHAESKLRELEKKHKSIFELTLDGIVTVDLKGVVISCNKTFLRLTGYLSDEIINKHFTELPSLLKKDIPKYTRILKSLIKGKVPKPFEAVWIHKNGTTRVV